jgi:hypothetical protein
VVKTPYTTLHDREVPLSAGQFLQWHDLFVVIDDGAIPLPRYDEIETAMLAQAKSHPTGITCLVILPVGARPPAQDVKDRVKSLLGQLGPSLRALAYLIEDSGFKAVAARTALIAMKVFSARPYPIVVETSMESVLDKLLPKIKGSTTAAQGPTTIIQAIADARAKWAQTRVA